MLSPIGCGISSVGTPKPRSTDKTMHRWTAKFLLLAMLLPAFGPLALARADQPEAMHCMRTPVQTVQPAMHCHHGMAQAPAQEAPERSFRALGGCCQNHDCCRGLKTSGWARPASNLLPYVSLLVEGAPTAQLAAQISANLPGQDSTRAPPRG
ncbi:MAG: hypothetical protein LAO56_09620 [Acidobacteriia bacterium]|nr:hypothetical protein [Terriglobia bacterium]